MPKVKQPKTSLAEGTTNLTDDTTNQAVDGTTHVDETTTHAENNDKEMRKWWIAEIRAKWTATREANKQRERAKEEEVRSTLSSLKQETEPVKTKLAETSKYEFYEIESLRRELSTAIEELKNEKRRARTLKRVEFYGDNNDDDYPPATHHTEQPSLLGGAHPPPPLRHPPWQRTQSFSQNPFNTY
eukprot:6185192-Pleurochrysis_carterae.AAC.3